MRMQRLLLVPLVLLVAVTAHAGTVYPQSPKEICDELPRRPVETPLVTVESCDWVCQAARIQTDYIRWQPCCDDFWPYGLGLSSGAAAAATASVFVGCH